jgi:hypothetical protein
MSCHELIAVEFHSSTNTETPNLNPSNTCRSRAPKSDERFLPGFVDLGRSHSLAMRLMTGTPRVRVGAGVGDWSRQPPTLDATGWRRPYFAAKRDAALLERALALTIRRPRRPDRQGDHESGGTGFNVPPGRYPVSTS